MIKVMDGLNPSLKLIRGMSFLALLAGVSALMMSVFIPSVHAYDVNILADRNLTIGSTGQNVVVLQGLLSEMGYLNVPTNVSFGYYGSLTKNALAQYQLSQSVSPSVGYFGPMTKVAMHQQFSSRGWLTMLGW